MNLKKKIILWIFVFSTVLILILTYYANQAIIAEAKTYTTSAIDQIIPLKTGLLLGTSKTLKNGQPNDYFYNRTKAAIHHFKQGKIKYLIVSGDNSKENYNEPLDMKTELKKHGIPDSVIFLDYAGFRTFDSVIRAKEIFGQDSILIISQKFHNERAIYIARKNDLSAWGYNAEDVNQYKGIKTKIREYFARAKVFFDIWFGIKPKFLGPKIKI